VTTLYVLATINGRRETWYAVKDRFEDNRTVFQSKDKDKEWAISFCKKRNKLAHTIPIFPSTPSRYYVTDMYIISNIDGVKEYRRIYAVKDKNDESIVYQLENLDGALDFCDGLNANTHFSF
jgi:hypothetical protein